MTDSQKLLSNYSHNGSEEAFRELVARYIDLVYSTAARLAGGDKHLAEDVAQIVFVDLARAAKSLSREVRLGGWLHRHTCFVAAKTLRGERRRQFRERQAAEMNALENHSEENLSEIAPMLDEAINQLGPADRTAIVLRFYERLDFRSAGKALGTNEDAAQKRVTRALEKLRNLLKHRGATFSGVALGTALTREAVTAAPVELAVRISGSALVIAGTKTGNMFSLLKLMAKTKLQAGIFTAIVACSVVMPLLVQHHAQARLREQNDALRQQSTRMAQLTEDNQRLDNFVTQAKNFRPSSNKQLHELMKLRDEVGRLRSALKEMIPAKGETPLLPEGRLGALKTMYAAQVDRLRQWLEANPSEKIPEFKDIRESTWLTAVQTLGIDNNFASAASNLRANAEGSVFAKLWSALPKYAQANNGQFPTAVSQLNPYFLSPIDDIILGRYEILSASNLVSELQPGGDWVITQKAPINPALDLRDACSLTNMRMADVRVTNRWTLIH